MCVCVCVAEAQEKPVIEGKVRGGGEISGT